MALTERLGRALDLKSGMRVLDVAAVQGTSAVHLAKTFGCELVGVDLGPESARKANEATERAGVAHLAHFIRGDAEGLPVEDAAFDAVVCECAFCAFPDKPTAARVLPQAQARRPGRHKRPDAQRRDTLRYLIRTSAQSTAKVRKGGES